MRRWLTPTAWLVVRAAGALVVLVAFLPDGVWWRLGFALGVVALGVCGAMGWDLADRWQGLADAWRAETLRGQRRRADLNAYCDGLTQRYLAAHASELVLREELRARCGDDVVRAADGHAGELLATARAWHESETTQPN